MSIKIFDKYGDPRRQAATADQDPHGLAPVQVERMAQRMEEMLPKLSSDHGGVRTVLDDILPKNAALAPSAGAGYKAARQKHANMGLGMGSSGQGNTGVMQTVQRPYQPEFACLTADTPVFTPSGDVILVGDLRVGDPVLGSDGKTYTVTRKASAGVPEELIDIETWGAESFTVTSNHKWLAWVWNRECLCGCGTAVAAGRNWAPNHYRAGGEKTIHKHGSKHRTSPRFKAVPESYEPVRKIKADELHPEDCLLIPRKFDAVQTNVTEDDARLLGYYVAEGHIEAVDYAVRFSFGAHELETWIADTRNILKKKGIDSTVADYSYRGAAAIYTTNDRGKNRPTVSALVNWLSESGGQYSKTKRLSSEVMRWPLNLKRSLLTGMLRGDGSQFYATTKEGEWTSRSFTVSYTTTSEVLARQVVLLLAQCGFPSRIVKAVMPDKFHYRVDVKGGDFPRQLADLVWGEQSKASNFEKSNNVAHACMVDDDFVYVPIKKLTLRPNIDRAEVFTIAVSADDELYCLGKSIPLLTSNSQDRQSYPVHRSLANRYWRLFYKLDPVIGTCLDMYGEMPWGNVSFSGEGVDGEVKDVMEYSWDACLMRTILPAATREFYIVGEAAPHLFFDDSKGCWTYCALHNPDQLDIIDAPFIKMDPVAEFIPDDRLRQVLHSSHHSLQKVRESMPQELLARLTSGQNIPLSPINFTFLPRKLHPYDTRGTSIISRLWRILMYEDAIFEASLATARRHAGPLKVAKIGDPATGYIPGPEHEQRLLELLAQAELDVNAWLVYNYAVSFEMVGTSERVMTIDKHNDVIERIKLIALGVSKSFLAGEVTYASAATGLTVFLRRLKSVRQHFESSWLLPKFFLQMAKINKWVKPTQAELDHRVRVRRSSREVSEDNRYIMPTLEWDRSLDPSVDNEMISAMQNLQQLGVNFSKSTLYAQVGRDFEEESRQRVTDAEFEQEIFKDHPELMAPAGDPGMGGGGAGGGGMLPGMPAGSFGDLEDGEGAGAADLPPPDGASATADGEGKPEPTRPNPFKETDRISIWSKSDVEDLISMMQGEEPESDPWIDAYKNVDVQRALRTEDPDEIWEAVEDFLADEQFPSNAVTKLVDILKAMNVLGKTASSKTVSARAKEAQLLEMIDGYGNPDVGF